MGLRCRGNFVYWEKGPTYVGIYSLTSNTPHIGSCSGSHDRMSFGGCSTYAGFCHSERTKVWSFDLSDGKIMDDVFGINDK